MAHPGEKKEKAVITTAAHPSSPSSPDVLREVAVGGVSPPAKSRNEKSLKWPMEWVHRHDSYPG